MTGLAISRLRLDDPSGHAIVDGVALSLSPGEVVGLIGESGSGKTTLGLAAMAHLRTGVVLGDGEVRLGEESLFDLDEASLQRTRGARISYLSQDPAAALNPALRIDRQVGDVLDAHEPDVEPGERIREVLTSVSLPTDPGFLARYPHQLSGGQLRRVAIAIALVCNPEVLVLDEPTSGLDRSTVAEIVDLVRGLCATPDLSVLWITHALDVAAAACDRIAVMYAGNVVEEGPTADVLTDPAHPYTRHLLAAAPDPAGGRPMVGLDGRVPAPGERPVGCRFAPRCDLAHEQCRQHLPEPEEVAARRRARCVVPFAVPIALRTVSDVRRPLSSGGGAAVGLRDVGASYGGVVAVRDVSIEIGPGSWLAVVGASGSGKTTLLRSIAGMHTEGTGEIALDGTPLARSVRRRTDAQRRAIRLVSQLPSESFNPRRTIGDSIDRPSLLTGATRAEARRATHSMLDRVALDSRVATRFPTQLSGGELQRAAIARALIGGPSLLLCDEITSSLDTVVQAAIVELIVELHSQSGMTVVFVSHDLALVGAVADRTVVMADGAIVEHPPAPLVGADRR